MLLEDASWPELLPVFRETYRIWSPGLGPEDYRRYLYLQQSHRWSRKNYRYLALKRNGRVVCSCKLYTVQIGSRGRSFKFGGLGAVFTQPEERGLGYASELMEEVIELTHSSDYDGLLLFSDIGPQLYEQFGFDELGSADFYVFFPRVPPPQLAAVDSDQPAARFTMSDNGELYDIHTFEFEKEHIPIVTTHYMRWLRTQPFGFERPYDYWAFKLAREQFLTVNSRLSWPALTVTFASKDDVVVGYALTEIGGATLRVLEVVGPYDVRNLIWRALLLRMADLKLVRLRGWEGLAADYSPNFTLKKILRSHDLKNVYPPSIQGQMNYYERTWGRGMILSFNPQTRFFAEIQPCPLLELDHL